MSDVQILVHPTNARPRINPDTFTALDRLAKTLQYQDAWVIAIHLDNGILVTAEPHHHKEDAA